MIDGERADLVERSAIKYHEQLESFGNGKYGTIKIAYMNDIDALPTVDAVPVGAYTQVRWERDIAVGQLEKLGYALGEKVTPVKHGRWKAVTDDGDEYKRICSCCGEEAPFDNGDEAEGYYLLYPHCPWCGAKMDGKDGNV